MLIGSLQIAGARRVHLAYNTNQSGTIIEIIAIGGQHRDDIINGTQNYPIITNLTSFREIDSGYVIGAVKLRKIDELMSTYGDQTVLNSVINIIDKARLKTVYKSSEILENSSSMTEEGILYNKRYQTNNFYYEEIQLNGELQRLIYRDSETELILFKERFSKKRIQFEYDQKDISTHNNKLAKISMKTFSMSDVRNHYDLSWYEDENGNKLKDYGAIHSFEEFCKDVVFPVTNYINKCRLRNEQAIITIDTETLGLLIYNLSVDNPIRDTITALPISWAEDQARVIFLAMEKFNNLEIKYLVNFLKRLTENKWEWEDNTVDLYDDYYSDFEECPSRNLFIVKRDWYRIIGHNVMFDGKVLFQNGIRPWWDDDTLQMAFNLNPEASKAKIPHITEKVVIDGLGNKNKVKMLDEIVPGVGLKNLTRRLFDHETLELSEILGKGNEGNYHLIEDEEVAVLYGCADADYTRKVYFALVDLYKSDAPGLLDKYREQDMPLLNILYEAEYNGLLMDEDKVKEMALRTKEDLDIIHNFLQKFAGEAISIKSQSAEIDRKRLLGEISSAEARLMKSQIKPEENAFYAFEMKNSAYSELMYDKLGYPELGDSTSDKKRRKVGKPIRKLLMMETLEHNTLKEDVLSSDGEHVLIEKSKFNNYRFPVAYVIEVYSKLRKEYDSYFKPILEHNLEGKIFNAFSMARIATRRIMNASQTMKTELKNICLPFDGGKDWYMADQDMAQVEYRIMVSDAGQLNMIERLNDPEKDFHTESASLLSGTPAHLITHAFRKSMKSVNFGIPYGLGERNLCKRIFGEVNEENLYRTRDMLHKFAVSSPKVMAKLNWYKTKALEPVNFSDKFKEFTGFVTYETEDVLDEYGNVIETKFIPNYKPIGRVQNPMGFWRLFDLSKTDKKTIGDYQRAAGNLPIQGYAAELFRVCLIRFYKRCVKEGISDKVKWHLLIHDEVLYSVHKSVHPALIYKIVREECMLHLPGHTTYFWGIGFGRSWGEAKSDHAEAPVRFVDWMIDRLDKGEFDDVKWMDEPYKWIANEMHYWKTFIRIPEEINTIQENFSLTKCLDLKHVLSNITNYTVRGYIGEYEPSIYKDKDCSSDEHFLYSLIGWANEYLNGEGTVIISDEVYPLSKFINNNTEEKSDGNEPSNEIDDIFSELKIGEDVDSDNMDALFDDIEDLEEMNIADSDELLGLINSIEEFDFDKMKKEYNEFSLGVEGLDGLNISLNEQLRRTRSSLTSVVSTRGSLTISVSSAEEMEKMDLLLKDFKSKSGDIKLYYKIVSRGKGIFADDIEYKTVFKGYISNSITPKEIDDATYLLRNDKINIANGVLDSIVAIGNKVNITKELPEECIIRLIKAIQRTESKKKPIPDKFYNLYDCSGEPVMEVNCCISPVLINKAVNQLLKEAV